MNEQVFSDRLRDNLRSEDGIDRPAGSLQDRWLYIPVEIKLRELDSKLLLACCAAERGAKALIGEFGLFNKFSRVLPQGIVYEKDLSPRKQKILREYKEAGHRIVANEEEALVCYQWPEYFHYTRISDEGPDIVDLFFCWGQRQSDQLAELVPTLTPKLRTSGTQRTDLQREPLRQLYAKDAALHRKRFGPFILLPSNFGSLVTKPSARQKTIDKWYNSGRALDQDKLNWQLSQADHASKAIPHFLAALVRLREEFPEHSLIVRPHPTDSIDFWEKATVDIDNCHVVYEGMSLSWLMAADAVFHHGCGTAAEAYVLGQTAITYIPVADPQFDDSFEASLPPFARDLDTLVRLVGDTIGGRPVERADTYWFGQHMRLEGGLNVDMIVDELDHHDWGDLGPGKSLGALRRQFFQKRLTLSVQRRIRRLRRTGRLRAGTVDVREATAPVWTDTPVSELQDKLAFFQRALHRFNGLRIERVTRNLFAVLPDR